MRLPANGATTRCHGRPGKNGRGPTVIAAGRAASRHSYRARRWQPIIVGTSEEDLSPAEIASAAARGDERSRATMTRYIDRLARGLAMVINLIDPEAIVLGGGLSQIGSLYRDVPRIWGRYIFSDRVDTRLLAPAHGDASGVRGAAWLWPPGVRPDETVPRLQRNLRAERRDRE